MFGTPVPPGSELASAMKIGVRVVRGRDWKWGDQDGGNGGEGTVVRGLHDGYVRVEWDSGENNSYRMGHDGQYDLELSDTGPSTAFIPMTSTVMTRVLTPSGPDLASRMEIGVRVVRGRDWKWDDQDGGQGNVGTVIRRLIDGYVRVEWDSRYSNSYRMGRDGKYDLDLAEGYPLPTKSSTPQITTETTTSTRFPGPELASKMEIGVKVERGKDWIWDDQDGGPGGVGTVVREVSNGYVRVEWDSTGYSNSYRMGDNDKYDLDLAKLRPSPTTSTTLMTAITPTSATLTDLASRMKVGVKVVRGKDWIWGEQDGGPGSVGTVVRGLSNGYVRVEWGSGYSDSYRMGAYEKYDLDLAGQHPTSPSRKNITEALTTTTLTALASRMKVGVKVVRGRDWIWGDEDGGPGSVGTVVRGLSNGYVRVQWSSGHSESYRMGHYEKYDLDLAGQHPQQPTPPTPRNTTEALTTTTLSGLELAVRMVVGVKVIRGKDWIWGNQDGGPGNIGTVVRELLDGYVRVEWDSGYSNAYRMGHDDKYDLDLAELHPPVTTSAPRITTEALTTTTLSGLELAVRMVVGTKVIRGKDWKWGDQDGGPGSVGTVVRELLDGYVRVEWDSGYSNAYRMGRDDKYDLDLAELHLTRSTTAVPLYDPVKPVITNATCFAFSVEDIQGSSNKLVKVVQREFTGIPDNLRLQAMQEITNVLKKYSLLC